MNQKKPVVFLTRRLPESSETRMRELFDARLREEVDERVALCEKEQADGHVHRERAQPREREQHDLPGAFGAERLLGADRRRAVADGRVHEAASRPEDAHRRRVALVAGREEDGGRVPQRDQVEQPDRHAVLPPVLKAAVGTVRVR